MPPERRVITCPVLRPDGTVLQKPGLDRRTGLLYQPDVNYPPVEDTPSIAVCLARRDALLDLVAPWPFATPHHRSAWLAALFTCIAHPLIEGPCPLFVIDAQRAGLRKTTLVRLASSVAFGGDPAFLDPSMTSESFASRATEHIKQGASAIVIDNVVATSSLPLEHLLAAMSHGALASRATWWLTGNGITLPRRLWERSLRIALGSKDGVPSTAPLPDLRHPKWLSDGRPQLLSSALSLVRRFAIEAWHRTRGPISDEPFQEWTAFIESLFRWLDLPDPTKVRYL